MESRKYFNFVTGNALPISNPRTGWSVCVCLTLLFWMQIGLRHYDIIKHRTRHQKKCLESKIKEFWEFNMYSNISSKRWDHWWMTLLLPFGFKSHFIFSLCCLFCLLNLYWICLIVLQSLFEVTELDAETGAATVFFLWFYFS